MLVRATEKTCKGAMCPALKLRTAVRDDLRERLDQFRATSTLEDQMSEERVNSLYGLGRLMVHLRWPTLSRSLEESESHRGCATENTVAVPPLSIGASHPKPLSPSRKGL